MEEFRSRLLAKTSQNTEARKEATETLVGKKQGLLASNLRLIQLVEMGASTSKYRKSKQGGKLAMKSIAEELNFPTALV